MQKTVIQLLGHVKSSTTTNNLINPQHFLYLYKTLFSEMLTIAIIYKKGVIYKHSYRARLQFEDCVHLKFGAKLGSQEQFVLYCIYILHSKLF